MTRGMVCVHHPAVVRGQADAASTMPHNVAVRPPGYSGLRPASAGR